ncbi:MAG: PAS domain-containing protein [Oceanipulchritudo sp.]
MPHRTDIPAFADPLFRALFEQTREAVMLAEFPDGPIIVANQQAKQLLEREGAELDGVSLTDMCEEKNRALLESVMDSARVSGGRESFSGYLRRKDGSTFPCELEIQPVDTGEHRLMLVTLTDMTERVRAMEDIELRNIAIANVTSGVTVADARQKDLPLIYVNRGFQHITGYSAKEAVGRSCRFLQGEDRDQPELDVLREALRKGEACVVRLRNYRKDGSLFHNELHISPVRNERGELTHFVGIQLNVTEQVRARKSLERSEQRYRQALEQEKELNEIKSRFISMVSHEFRTPMTGMQASAGLLRRLWDRMDPEKRTRHLANIETALKRMNRLLDDVLFFSRAESNKVELKRTPLDVCAYLEKLGDGLSLIYPNRTISCECRLEPGSVWFLDEHLLDHILQNLIGNAIKYSPENTPVSCRVEENGDTLEFSVTDAGIGIPEADQDKLFEAFHRAGNVGTRQGTGLGLNIALRAIELLGGNISFTSRENKGSTFTVSLPKIQPETEPEK